MRRMARNCQWYLEDFPNAIKGLCPCPVCFVSMVLKQKMLLDYKAFETEHLDEEVERSALNLINNNGILNSNFENWICKLTFFPIIDDVWDDDLAYMELLTEQVHTFFFFSSSVLTNSFVAQSALLQEKAENREANRDEDEEDEEDEIEEEFHFHSYRQC
jgi:hypothetical protein